MALHFENPPPVKDGRGRKPIYLPLLAELREHPNRWAVLRVLSSEAVAISAASRLRRGKAPVPRGSFEYAVRGRKLYARYLNGRAR
jgi:hypothetical protein